RHAGAARAVAPDGVWSVAVADGAGGAARDGVGVGHARLPVGAVVALDPGLEVPGDHVVARPAHLPAPAGRAGREHDVRVVVAVVGLAGPVREHGGLAPV